MPVTDRLRRRGVLPAAVLLLAAPALASCGFDYATDRVNTIAPGTNDRSGDVKVLGAAVIAESDGVGVFIATLANGTTEDDSLDGLTGTTSDGGTLEAGSGAASVDIPPGGRASLVEEGGIPVTGEFAAGDFVTISLTFGNGQTTSIETNVVRPCYQYSPDKLGELNFPESGASEEEPAESDEAESDEAESEGEEAGPDAYACEPRESEVWKSGEEPHHGEAE